MQLKKAVVFIEKVSTQYLILSSHPHTHDVETTRDGLSAILERVFESGTLMIGLRL